jgi:hypothetical protein
MGVTQSTSLNDDTNARVTTGEFGNRGDGTNAWYHWFRVADGGDVTQGDKDDAAVTDPTSSGTLVALLKGLLTFLRVSAAGVGKAEDAVAASGDTGVMALAVRRDARTADGANGDYVPLHVDADGRLRVQLGTPSNATSTALEVSRVVKASAGTLYGLSGYTTTAQFVQVYNATAVPGTGGTPVVTFPVEANKPFSIDFGITGRVFSTGICVSNSTTGPTRTAGASDTWFDVQFE